MASPQEEQGILGAFGSIMDFSRSWAGGMVPFGMGGLNSGGFGEPQGIPQQQGGIDQALLAAGQAAQQGVPLLIDDSDRSIGGEGSRMEDFLGQINGSEVQTLEDEPLEGSNIAEATIRDLMETSIYTGVPEGEMDWDKIGKQAKKSPYEAAFTAQIMANIPEGADQKSMLNKALLGLPYALGAHILSQGLTSSEDMPSFFSSLEGGRIRKPKDTEKIMQIFASASKHKGDEYMSWEKWKEQEPELLKGLSNSAIRKAFLTVKNDDEEIALIAAHAGYTGQGRLGQRQIDSLTRFKKNADQEPIMTMQPPTNEGYISKWMAKSPEASPSSPLVYTKPGFPRIRLGGLGVEATGFPGPQSSI